MKISLQLVLFFLFLHDFVVNRWKKLAMGSLRIHTAYFAMIHVTETLISDRSKIKFIIS